MADKIGILGGTFNPVHNGHLTIALSVKEALGLNLVYLVPSSNPPHKNSNLLPYQIRRKMLEIAIEPYPHLQISDLDYTPGRKSYTKHLIQAFREEHPLSKLFFLIGADNIPQLASWFDHQWLLDNVNIVAVNRPGNEIEEYRNLDYFPKLTVIDAKPVDISSAEIRRRLADGKNIDHLVPAEVARFIVSKNLYRNLSNN
jgi:nicotinate-nucleotide adenylyltransferase